MTHVGRGGGGLATITAGGMTVVTGFWIAILSRRALARMRLRPSSASLAMTSSFVAAGRLAAAGLAARVALSFASRASAAGFAAADTSAVSLGRALPSDDI